MNGNGKPEPEFRPARGCAVARVTKFKPLIAPELSVSARAEVAHALINQLAEQLFLGGSLVGWQVAHALSAVAGLWERYPRRTAAVERLLIQRFERDHVKVCEHCGGSGTVPTEKP